MADEFQSAGMCSTGGWWSTTTRSAAAFDGTVSSVSCSTAIADTGIGGVGFGWSPAEVAGEGGKARSGEEPVGSGSGSSITYQDSHKAQVSDPMISSSGNFMDSTLQMSGFGLASPASINWSQALMSSSGRAETSFHAMLQEDLSSSRPYFQQESSSMEAHQGHLVTGDSSPNPFKAMNQGYLLDQHHLSSAADEHTANFPLVSASYGCPSTLLQGLLEPENKPGHHQQSLYQSPMPSYRGGSNELSQPSSWNKFPQFLEPSPAAAALKQPLPNQLQFSNNTPFWNASTAAGAGVEVRSSFYPSTPDQFPIPNFDQKAATSSSLTIKANSEGVGDSTAGVKKGGSEPAFKKPRIETPSPLPTFKVRKEKLGDRITALQQLVSPFGKTDTASVLHEAIEYIKFLHEQVGVLSTPYLKNGHPMQQQQHHHHQQQQQQSSEKSKDGEPKQDLRSRGLCLVPIANTFPVAASETTADFWTPTFGGTYR